MSARIKELKDINDNKIYPVTVIDAVYMPDGKRKLLDEVKSTGDRAYSIYHITNGYRKTYENGDQVTVTYDGMNIREEYKYADGSVYYVKTKTFNPTSGKTDVDIEYSEGVRDGN